MSAVKWHAVLGKSIMAGALVGTTVIIGKQVLPDQLVLGGGVLLQAGLAFGLGLVWSGFAKARFNAQLNQVMQDIDSGKLASRLEPAQYRGQSRQAAETVNRLLDTMVEKNVWYEAIIDAVPLPINVIDNELKWTFMNATAAQHLVAQGICKDRQSAYGMACHNVGATICNTEQCGVKQLLKGNPETYFDFAGMNMKQHTSYLKNSKGEPVGYVEVVTDLTAVLRVNEYAKGELSKVEANLHKLANGDLEFDLQPQAADQYTVEVKAQFERINSCLALVKATIEQMANEGVKVINAAREGQMDIRSDHSTLKGVYAQLLQGFNETLEALGRPMNEAREIISRMGYNDYTQAMTGNYQGMMQEFANAINLVRERFLSVQDAVVKASEGDTSRLEELKRIGQRSKNDQLAPAVTKLMQTIHDMSEEVRQLTEAASSGNLKLRGNPERFAGGYRAVIAGFNQTLDAINAPVQEAVSVLQEMAQGNFEVAMTGDYQGDHAVLQAAINTTLDSLNEVMADIHIASRQVAAGAAQVSDSSQVLSQGASEQASTMQEISASVMEIAAQTKQNALNANQANELSLTAKTRAVAGNEQMQAMLQAMEEINLSSANISKIIKVIDEIAFQTNILALNAAVEAARAGQHGKGFAVVAEEVRNLAARSAKAAKETTAMIEGSLQKVDTGTRIANETAVALGQIVDGVTRAAELVGEIAIASNEQATGIAQINQGIDQVSQVIQSNTATSEQGAAASVELSGQAERLRENVDRFKIKGLQEAPALLTLNPDTPVTPVKRAERQGRRPKISLEDQEFAKY